MEANSEEESKYDDGTKTINCFHKLKLLFWKNFLVQIRNLLKTCTALMIILAFTLPLSFIDSRLLIIPLETYNPFGINDFKYLE